MSNLVFNKYPSITNADSKKTIDYILQGGYNVGDWQVTLKVHGANFCFIFDGITMTSGKRSGFIESGDGGFHNYQNVIAMYQQKIQTLFEYYLLSGYTFSQITLFGELFGGAYDHPEVPKDPHASRVQKGVEYCPHNDFFLFDIKVDELFLPKTHVHKAINKFGFIGGEPLFTGTFEECLEYNERFSDPLHKLFNLPPVDGENVCEGIVIEPVLPTFFPSGSRVILKKKNKEFSEKKQVNRERKTQTVHEWSEEGFELCSHLLAHVSESRLRNILSHIGEVEEKDFGKILGLFCQDALKDFRLDFGDEFDALDKKEQDLMKKEMQRECANCIRPNFRNILDGEF